MKDYNHGNKKKNWNKFWKFLIILVFVFGIFSIFIAKDIYNRELKPVNSSQQNVLIVIDKGSTISQIAEKLEKEGLIKKSWAFMWYVREHNAGANLQAGSYYLRPNMGVRGIVEVLTQGKIATNLFTILPGQRIDQIRNALINNGGYSEQDVNNALMPSKHSTHPALIGLPAGASLEGYLFPESFQKNGTTKPDMLISQSLDQLSKHLTNDFKNKIAKHNLTVHEAIILASIVEREVSNVDDKKIVAQVFLLRLKNGMKLQSDPTAFYGALIAGDKPSLGYQSEYNTYQNTGLPVGPISNVSKASLEAVANPSSTDYIYFVSGDNGITYFSHTLAEHEKNIGLHCKKLCGGQ